VRRTEQPRRFAHAWTPSHDNQIGLLQPAKQVVQIGEARRDTDRLHLLAVKLFDAVVVLGHSSANRDQFLAQPALGHSKQRRFRLVNETRDVGVFLLRQTRDGAGSSEHSPAQRGALDDAPVGLGVDGRGRVVDQVGDIGRAPDLLQPVLLAQFLHHRQVVNLLAALVQPGDGFPYPPVAHDEKIFALQERGDIVQRIGVDQDRAEHGLFGFDAVGSHLLRLDRRSFLTHRSASSGA